MITLQAGELSLDLAPEVGGAVARFDHGTEPLMRRAAAGFSDPLDAACFPLAPFCNRIRDGRFTFDGRTIQLDPMAGQRHPLHGQGWRAPWSVSAHSASGAILAYDHPPADWPWAYRAQQGFDLDAGGLTVTLCVVNQSDTAMPCGLGLHPYFPCTGETVLDAQVDGVWTIDQEVMPVGREPADGRYSLGDRRICGADLDNGFDGWRGAARITWPERDLQLTLSAPTSYFQVYSPSAGGLFVAEGVTHANAALNLPQDQWAGAGIHVLQPGHTQTLVTRFEVRSGL